ncbi:MAG: DapH/DapD/GlmU-related protein [Thalassospira sp.]|uniref:DapH/DapD/GlmU-related protein n=1 Tax=Thalassospira sp. TaxID=1912094 RepID=UPI0032ECA3E9
MIGSFHLTINELIQFAEERSISAVGESSVCTFNGVAPINEAGPNDIAFCRFDGESGERWLRETKASAIFITPSLIPVALSVRSAVYLPCEAPRLDFSLLLKRHWQEPQWNTGSGGNPDIHPLAKLAHDVKVGPFTTIGPDVEIGQGTRIGAGCHIEYAQIGEHCQIGSNSVIGSPGFGYEDDTSGTVIEFPHVGTVILGNRVRVGASCCIDRSALGATKIGNDTKLDNNVHVGHNARIGQRCKLTASVTVSGSVSIDDDCWLAPNSVIRDWRSVGKDTLIGIGAVITKDVEDHSTMFGNPARPIPRPKNRYR